MLNLESPVVVEAVDLVHCHVAYAEMLWGELDVVTFRIHDETVLPTIHEHDTIDAYINIDEVDMLTGGLYSATVFSSAGGSHDSLRPDGQALAIRTGKDGVIA